MNNSELGNLGEIELDKWCTLSGIVANKAFNDKKGWDFLLQFKEEDNPEKPNIDCLVQVKSTYSQDFKFPVKLSNWRSLATSSLPTFYLLFRYEQNNPDPIEVKLVHINKGMVIRTLSKLRHLRIKKQQHRLHKSKWNIPLKESINLQKPFGENLKYQISKIVGDVHGYQKQKIDIIERSGNPIIRINYKVSSKENDPELFIDWILGLKKMSVTEIRSVESRFNIEEEKRKIKVGKLMYIPHIPHVHLDIILKDDRTGIESMIPVILKRAEVKNHSKTIIKGKCVEMILEYKNNKMTLGRINSKGLKQSEDIQLSDIRNHPSNPIYKKKRVVFFFAKRERWIIKSSNKIMSPQA